MEIIKSYFLSRRRHQGVRIWNSCNYFQSEERGRANCENPECKLSALRLYMQIVGKKERFLTRFSRKNKKAYVQLDRDQQTLDTYVRQLPKVTGSFLHGCPSVYPFCKKASNCHRTVFTIFHPKLSDFAWNLTKWPSLGGICRRHWSSYLRHGFLVFYELTPKIHLSHKHRAWSTISNIDVCAISIVQHSA